MLKKIHGHDNINNANFFTDSAIARCTMNTRIALILNFNFALRGRSWGQECNRI